MLERGEDGTIILRKDTPIKATLGGLAFGIAFLVGAIFWAAAMSSSVEGITGTLHEIAGTMKEMSGELRANHGRIIKLEAEIRSLEKRHEAEIRSIEKRFDTLERKLKP